jgi:hypothetical protein
MFGSESITRILAAAPEFIAERIGAMVVQRT